MAITFQDRKLVVCYCEDCNPSTDAALLEILAFKNMHLIHSTFIENHGILNCHHSLRALRSATGSFTDDDALLKNLFLECNQTDPGENEFPALLKTNFERKQVININFYL